MPQSNQKRSMSSQKAYRDWGTFKYWFRGIEKYASWVNHIYLVTDNQIPEWLNIDHKKVTVIDHKDIIAEKYLPTFNSNAIEANIHRIPGLAEHFVIFNDDMYLTNRVLPTDFFDEVGNPKSRTCINPIIPERYGTANFQVNNMEIINEHFTAKQIVKNAKLLSLKQGLKNVIRSVLYCYSKTFIGFWESHMPYAMLKSTYNLLWEKESRVLEITSSNRFRNKTDTNLWLFKYWQLASGKTAINKKNIGLLFTLSNSNEYIWQVLHTGKFKVMCINDGFDISDRTRIMQEFITNMEEEFPLKSNFEI
ncbi:capsular polysaccharide phosphotransferase eps10H [Ligilactobacillus equi DPC 6820]|uniref:Capsular polysaccharide phosphotransferase eps10H n=2 Tax=Ligilactobacillus equi TaxID=137357 RepID=V7HYV9_9LACO|nr:capsular polysaccharide phosphotransferase eps10H [Ligilactobacillus equi DPC 6820]